MSFKYMLICYLLLSLIAAFVIGEENPLSICLERVGNGVSVGCKDYFREILIKDVSTDAIQACNIVTDSWFLHCVEVIQACNDEECRPDHGVTELKPCVNELFNTSIHGDYPTCAGRQLRLYDSDNTYFFREVMPAIENCCKIKPLDPYMDSRTYLNNLAMLSNECPSNIKNISSLPCFRDVIDTTTRMIPTALSYENCCDSLINKNDTICHALCLKRYYADYSTPFVVLNDDDDNLFCNCTKKYSGLKKCLTPLDIEKAFPPVKLKDCGCRFEKVIDRCILKCNSTWMYSEDDKQSVKSYIFIASCVSLIVTVLSLMTLLYFFLKRKKNVNEEATNCKITRSSVAVVYSTVCYVFYSIVHIIRGSSMYGIISCASVNNSSAIILITNTHFQWKCYLTFACLYCFYLASRLWWLFMTVSWFIEAKRKWGPDAKNWRWIELCGHCFAWIVPLAIVAFVWSKEAVEASELTGLCFIGHKYFRVFNVYLIGVLESIGIIIFLTNLFYIVIFLRPGLKNIHDSERRKRAIDEGLKRKIKSILMYTLLYCIPAIIVVILNGLESVNFEYRGNCEQSKTIKCQEETPPNRLPVLWYGVKIVMMQIVGISTIWVKAFFKFLFPAEKRSEENPSNNAYEGTLITYTSALTR